MRGNVYGRKYTQRDNSHKKGYGNGNNTYRLLSNIFLHPLWDISSEGKEREFRKKFPRIHDTFKGTKKG
jgi:hypothetical protein